MDPKGFVLISVFKTSLEVPVIFQFCVGTLKKDRMGKKKLWGRGIKLKCHLQKWWWNSQEDGIIHLRT